VYRAEKARFAMKYLTQDWYGLLTQRAASRRGGNIFWPALALVVLTLNLYAPAPPTITERLLASAIILVAFGAIWRWIYRGEGEPEFGFLPVALIFFSLEYALPIFAMKVYSMEVFTTNSLPDPVIEKSLALALAGLIAILFGYYYPGRRWVARRLPKPRMSWRDKRVLQSVSLGFAGLGMFVFVVTLNLHLSPEIQAYVNQPSQFFAVATIALLILQLEGELAWGFAVTLWIVLLPLYAVIGMAQGILGFAMVEAAALLITYTTLRRRIPWVIFLLGFAIFFFIQPVKGYLRSMVFDPGGWANRDQDQSQKLGALIATGEQGLTVMQTLEPQDLFMLAAQRLASIMVFATLVEQTPQNIPYWEGSTYYPLLFVAIPRLVDPEKPSDLPGNVFGHQYGLLSVDNYVTSINVAQLLELYGNFGPLGVVLGSILIGMIYRTINDLFVQKGSGLGALVGGVYLFTHLLDIENAASSVFGGLLFEFITVLIFHFAIRFIEHAVATYRLRQAIHSGETVLKLEIAQKQY